MKNFRLLTFLFLTIFVEKQGFAINPTNPFQIPFKEKTELTNEDFIEVQQLLRLVNLQPVIQSLCHNNSQICCDDCLNRCSRGIRQVLIDPKKGFYPKQELIKIGSGSNRCIVCCAPFRITEDDAGIRALHVSQIANALSKTGFNGYFLSLVGGFPNPSGKEICYAGVPYSFKIFMMLEAYKLGLSSVIWIDSACLPLKDPTPLFEDLEKKEALLSRSPPSSDEYRYIFKETVNSIEESTGINVLHANYFVTIVFGLKMDSERVKKLIELYYDCVDKGTPFLSCFPEEFVLSAITARKEFSNWRNSFYKSRLFTRAGPGENDSEETMRAAKQKGHFFYQRAH